MVRYIVGMICSLLLMNSCFADTQLSAGVSLKQFLQSWSNDKTTRYVAVFRDLNSDDVPEAIVYLADSRWCGSGGCNMLVLTQDGNSWRIISNITITRPPIRMLSISSNGWHSIGVWVRGGGIQHGYEAELSFDGKTYSRNPTVSPSKRLEEKITGEDVITSTKEALPLW
jgi:hypothetical protein